MTITDTARPTLNLFSTHHIGGRNGRGGFPSILSLNSSRASTVYEADPACCPQIEEEQKKEGYAEVRVVPDCVGLSGESVLFNINFEPYTSSMLVLNPKYREYYYDMGRFDYTYKCAMSPVRQVRMSTVSLDDLTTKLPIDFLSLDTQGSEFEILRGAEQSLAHAIGVETEVSFRQIYDKSAMFGEIQAFLAALGFEFIRFSHITEDGPRSMPTAGRLRKMQSFGDALFLRVPSMSLTELQKRKLIFAALAYGQVEYAGYCVRQFTTHDPQFATRHHDAEPRTASSADSRGESTWSSVVDQFVSIVANSREAEFPRILSAVTTVEESHARFDLEPSTQTNSSAAVHPVKQPKHLFTRLPRWIQVAIIRVLHIHQVVDYFVGKPSKLESLYAGLGQTKVAKELRVSRFRRIFPLTFSE